MPLSALPSNEIANPPSLTDNSGGSVLTAFAANIGVMLIGFKLNLASVTAADIIAAVKFGFKFKIRRVFFLADTPVTTGAKAATLTPKIGTTALTGGVVALTSANCTPMGAQVAGSAVTAANTGSATDTITVTASAVTAFSEGSGTLYLEVQNMEEADAIATLVNDFRQKWSI